MSTDDRADPPGTGSSLDPEEVSGDLDRAELAAQLDVLREENERLRGEYARARRSRYRRTALAMLAVGLVGVAGGVLFPSSRTVLFALGGTGVFASLLTYYLTPVRVVPATVGERVYSAFAGTGRALVDELGCSDRRVYVPLDGDADEADGVARLYVPQRSAYDLPDPDHLRGVFVVTDADDRRGIAIEPTGCPLFREFERTLTGEFATAPGPLTAQLVEGLVEQFELVDGADPDVGDDGRVTVGIVGSAYAAVDRFDHPVASFLGVGLAVGLDQPVTVETARSDDDRADYLVTCRWETDLDG